MEQKEIWFGRLPAIFKHVLLVVGCVVCPMVSAGDYLYPGTQLNIGQWINSATGKYNLIMQADGNLVMYRNDGTVRWRLGSNGWFAIMQTDGNFVEYNGLLSPVWYTGTNGHPGALLHIQDDGNLVVYSQTWVPLWNIGAEPGPKDPRLAADVVVRDLDFPIGGFIGHAGIYDGGGNVIEIEDATDNAVRVMALNQFESTTHNFWGTASPNIPSGITSSGCYRTDCYTYADNEQLEMRVAMIRVAYVISLIGATYTITAQWQPYYHGTTWNSPSRGVFRCDTFVLYAMEAPQPYAISTTERQRWRSFIDNFLYLDDKNPKLVFDRLGSYR